MLSVAEKSYLYDSLRGEYTNGPTRPDGRLAHQFRPLEVFRDFLPSSNGSARIAASDGSECVVSVKAAVEQNLGHIKEARSLKDNAKYHHAPTIVIECSLAGQRDDSPQLASLNSYLNRVYGDLPELAAALQISERYTFRLYVDVLVLSAQAQPLALISFAIYIALKSTTLPLLVSSQDDLEVEAMPIFHDHDFVTLRANPPLIFLVSIYGNNILVDCSSAESEVADNALLITYANDKVIAPIKTLALNGSHTKSIHPRLIPKAIALVEKYAPEVIKSLND